jgi:hypothetical protein
MPPAPDGKRIVGEPFLLGILPSTDNYNGFSLKPHPRGGNLEYSNGSCPADLDGTHS